VAQVSCSERPRRVGSGTVPQPSRVLDRIKSPDRRSNWVVQQVASHQNEETLAIAIAFVALAQPAVKAATPVVRGPHDIAETAWVCLALEPKDHSGGVAQVGLDLPKRSQFGKLCPHDVDSDRPYRDMGCYSDIDTGPPVVPQLEL
jgi:hypothetical protein